MCSALKAQLAALIGQFPWTFCFCCYLWLILRNYIVSGELKNLSRLLQCVSTQSIKILHKLMTIIIIIIIIIVLIVITFKTGYYSYMPKQHQVSEFFLILKIFRGYNLW
jgi:NADH:ubiquinone oxidoreductase subunit 5 (subunit L)/multisubunit Na+/H+ antiporter MnhA subunit